MTKYLNDIFNQPEQLQQSLQYAVTTGNEPLQAASTLIKKSKHVFITAIGASWSAGLAIQSAFNQAGIQSMLCDAADFLHYTKIPADAVVIFLSRSGKSIEVVNAFPEEDGLQKFREWIESPDPAILGKLGVEQRSSSKKKGSRTSKKGTNNSKNKREGSAADYNPGQEDDDIEARNDVQNNKLSFMNKHVNLSSRFKWYLICSFLSLLTCFIFPLCDTCREM